MAVRYQITRRGDTFAGRPSRSLAVTMRRLRRRLQRLDGPYQIFDGREWGRERTRPDVVEAVRARLKNERVPSKFIVRGNPDNYDEPSWSVRSVHEEPPTHPYIEWGSQWVGRTHYQLGGSDLPGGIDCSGFTLRVVEHVSGIALPHLSDAQRDHSAVSVFFDADDLEQGDLVFLNYGRLSWPTIDHVEFFDRPGRTLGSRPSLNGVGWYSFGSYDRSRVICYGRVRG